MGGNKNNTKLTVGFLTSEYPHPKVNRSAGIATSLKNLALALVEEGVRVIVFVYSQPIDEIIISEGIELHLLAARNYKFGGWFLYRKRINNYVESVVRKEQIDILEAPDWTGITAFMSFSVPLVIRFHGSDAYFCKLDGRKQKWKNFFFEKKAISKANAYIAPTSFAGEITRKIFGLQKEKIKTIHYGLQLNNFVNSSPNIFNKNTILYVGTIIRKKGVLELAQIFNKVVDQIPDAQLILIGSDSADLKTGCSSTLQLVKNKLSVKASDQTSYLGKLPYNEVKDHIKLSHLCTFPSFAETLGMVTIESMALNKPVVNTSIGWAQEIIDDGINGYLVHPTQLDDYANRIVDLIKNETLSLKIGVAARRKVENCFDINKLVMVNIDYYKSICA